MGSVLWEERDGGMREIFLCTYAPIYRTYGFLGYDIVIDRLDGGKEI